MTEPTKRKQKGKRTPRTWKSRLSLTVQRRIASLERERDYWMDRCEELSGGSIKQMDAIRLADRIIAHQGTALRDVARAIVKYSKQRDRRLKKEIV